MVLTAIVALQMAYNLTGAMELGGKYMSLERLLYSVGSLVPGLALGIHAVKVTKASTEERRTHLLSKSHRFVTIARVYVGAFALVTLLLPISGYIGSTRD